MKRSAFTLVEFLIVSAIVAVLAGLLLGALARAREAAGRAACAHNLKQMGLALQNYHDAFGSFPPGMRSDAGDDLQEGGNGGFVNLLPFLEQQNWLRQWDWNKPWYEGGNFQLVSVQMKFFYCPSNRSGGTIDLQFLVGPAGRPLPNPAACDYLMCKGANAGLCQQTQVPWKARGVFDVNTRTRLAEISDGSTNTFAIGEGVGGNSRYLIRHYYPDTTPASDPYPGQPMRADQSWSSGPLATKSLNSNGFLGASCFGVTAERGGHAPPFDEPMNNPLVLAAIDNNHGCTNSGSAPGQYDSISGFRSVHPGGCNFLFCDGSVRFVQEKVSPDTYRALSTIAGSEFVSGE